MNLINPYSIISAFVQQVITISNFPNTISHDKNCDRDHAKNSHFIWFYITIYMYTWSFCYARLYMGGRIDVSPTITKCVCECMHAHWWPICIKMVSLVIVSLYRWQLSTINDYMTTGRQHLLIQCHRNYHKTFLHDHLTFCLCTWPLVIKAASADWLRLRF